MWKGEPQKVQQVICLSLKAGLDAEQTRDKWELLLESLVTKGKLRVSVNREHGGPPEILLDWNAYPGEIAQHTAVLQNRE